MLVELHMYQMTLCTIWMVQLGHHICVLLILTGNAPSSGGTLHASWDYLAKGQAVSPTTTQGDLIVRGASADERLAIGAAGKALKVNASGNGLEYGNGGGLVQTRFKSITTATTINTISICYTHRFYTHHHTNICI